MKSKKAAIITAVVVALIAVGAVSYKKELKNFYIYYKI